MSTAEKSYPIFHYCPCSLVDRFYSSLEFHDDCVLGFFVYLSAESRRFGLEKIPELAALGIVHVFWQCYYFE